VLTFDAIFCILASPAVPGAVKRGLGVDDRAAASLASAFFTDTWRSVAIRPGTAAVLACTGPPSGLSIQACGETWFQGPGDRGTRTERVLRRALARSPWAIALVADAPGMPADRIDALLEARRTHDAAVVPSEDGGIIALATARCPEGVLGGLAFGTPSTAHDVLARLQAAGLTVATLPGWWDVDTAADLERLRGWLAESPARARVTAAALGLATPP
jgi:uncharacterized protein